jgi:hypothetical protein
VLLPLLPMRRSMLGDFDLGDVVVVVVLLLLLPGGGLMTMCKSRAKMFFHSVT